MSKCTSGAGTVWITKIKRRTTMKDKKTDIERSKEMAKVLTEKLISSGYNPNIVIKGTSVGISVQGNLEDIKNLLIEEKGNNNDNK